MLTSSSSEIVLVCFYGPESTGKTTMAQRMAKQYNTAYVPEVGREIIKDNNAFTEEDITRTAREQFKRIREQAAQAKRVLFCDSDLITTAIYSRHYLGVVPGGVAEVERDIHFDRYFLFNIDVPWVDDGVRDLGSSAQREYMYKWFKYELEKRSLPFVEVRGTWKERERLVTEEIDNLLAS
jgi:HTH-type transcriptional regulator, transcriptional repressor of NAD biosynthesis genes